MSLLIDGLHAGYSGTKILTDVTIEYLHPGELVGVIGPNAAGKSTLFKSIAGVIEPMSGDILINGKSTFNMSRAQRAKHVAYMPQAFGCNAVLSVF